MAIMRRLRAATVESTTSAMSSPMSSPMSSTMSSNPDALDTGYVQALSSAALAQRLKARRWGVARGMTRSWPRMTPAAPRPLWARLGLLALLFAWAAIWLGGDLAALVSLGVLPSGGAPLLMALPTVQAPLTSMAFVIIAGTLLIWHVLGAGLVAFLVMQRTPRRAR